MAMKRKALATNESNMAIKRKARSQFQRSNDLDFRCPSDDAWCSVRLVKAKEGLLRVMHVNFFEDSDEWYSSSQFESLNEIEELLGTFRRPAKQLQDSQCSQVTKGMVVLACHEFLAGELLFYDATVDSVSQSEHRADDATEEQCTYQFNVTWKHGPGKGKNATVLTEHICLIQDLPVEDPVLEDFIDSARKSMEECLGNTSHGASPHRQVDDVIGQTRDRIGTPGEEKAEVARLKTTIAEMARAASALEKEKSKLERKVEHLEEVLSEELYFQKEKERYEGLLQELNATVARANAQAQIFKAQMQVAKAERDQAILAFYEVEAKLNGKRFKIGESEWKIPEHLTLPPSETVLRTIRYSPAFAPFRSQIEKAIREQLTNEEMQRKITNSSNNKKGEASTELASKGLTNAQKECVFFWVDNIDKDIEPPHIVKFLQRELSVSSQVMMFPDMFLDNTCSGAIFVKSREHKLVLELLKDCNNIIVSSKGRPWVTNKKCCGIFHYPMPWQEMNLDTENQNDATEIRVLCPGSKGYEEASKMHDLFKAHFDRIETLKQSLGSKELKLRNTVGNGSRSLPHPPKVKH